MSLNPRNSAFLILQRIEREDSYADILLDRELSNGEISIVDRALLTELVYGVLRRQGTLDYIIRQYSKITPEKLERNVLILLRLGIYQLMFLDRIPVSAAVNETVKLAHQYASRGTGFINAVLRQTDRNRDSIVWPDKVRNPPEWIAAKFSLPLWIAAEWIEQLGFEEAEELAKVMSEPPPLFVRSNELKVSRAELLEIFKTERIEAVPTRFSPAGLRVLSHSPLAALQSFKDGLFAIQDEASQIASLILGAVPGERLLDLCAAPGGKTTMLAQIMGNRGEIIACDVNPRRLAQVSNIAVRLGISIIRMELLDAEQPLLKIGDNLFDRLLVDAPCTGLGVLRRNPEARWRMKPDDLKSLSAKQISILCNAASVLRPGGTLVYSTCSTSAAENEFVVDQFLSRSSDYMLEDLRVISPQISSLCNNRGMLRTWPHRDGMDGFFAARMKKREVS